jgi:hypothetical protein
VAKKTIVLGYTRTDKAVLEPTHGAPNVNDIRVFHRARQAFVGWTRGDHEDASQILLEHGERNYGTKIGTWSTNWSSAHWHLGRFKEKPS